MPVITRSKSKQLKGIIEIIEIKQKKIKKERKINQINLLPSLLSTTITTITTNNIETNTTIITSPINNNKRNEIINENEINIKKIKLSNDEVNLNGAPEGELYDVNVLSDDMLEILLQPNNELTSSILILKDIQSNWALRHTAIENIRKICKYHSTLINEDIYLDIMNESCKEIESLRSCISRNGLLCLQALYKLSIQWKDNFHPVYERSIHLLMNKSSTGPKFLTNLIIETLNVGVCSIPVASLHTIFQPFNNHRNNDISSRSYQLVASTLRNNPAYVNELITTNDKTNDSLMKQYIQYLSNGLNSHRPISREECKECLKQIFNVYQKNYSIEETTILINEFITSDKRAEFQQTNPKKSVLKNNEGNKENNFSNDKSNNQFKLFKQSLKNQKVSNKDATILDTKVEKNESIQLII